MDPPKPKRVVPNFEAGDKVVAHEGTFKGKTGIVVKVDKSKSSDLAKLRMIVKLDKPSKFTTDPERKVSVMANQWKKTGNR